MDCKTIPLGREHADLRRQSEVEDAVSQLNADAMIIAAAKVWGIHANNSFPADFLYDNLAIELNLIHAAHQANIDRLLFSTGWRPKYDLREGLSKTYKWYVKNGGIIG